MAADTPQQRRVVVAEQVRRDDHYAIEPIRVE
jgi:hypothetical protein